MEDSKFTILPSVRIVITTNAFHDQISNSISSRQSQVS